MSQLFKYCPQCSAELTPFLDEDRIRMKCPQCGWVHYRNPVVGVAVVLIENGKILLGERRDGGWCIPCGYVEWDESIEEAAQREFLEETGMRVSLGNVLAVHSNFHNPDYQTVGIWFSGQRKDGEPSASSDLIQVAFFPLDQTPPLKFPNDAKVIGELIQE